MSLNKKLHRQHGDTIVEVMIVLAVLGSAIGISYATANRSLLNARQAQENAQAAEYVQSEAEDLRVLSPISSTANAGGNIFAPSAAYCIDNPAYDPNASPAVEPIIMYDSSKPTSDPASCSFGTIPFTILIYNCDKVPAVPTNPCNDPSITSTNDTFVVQAQWPDVLGQGTDSVTVNYRVHAQ